ncbi:MAG: MerR family transcriptional regulator [Syntrophomonadaceae bacterium]|nr:MerR family transcriptional regulator [Syntrophomonadaceae bacterium]
MRLSVSETAKLTGVSVRTLHYYDQQGLLTPSEVSAAGYRFYDEAALERLQQILFLRELDFPLKEIGRILARPDFDRREALTRQRELLLLKRSRLDKLIALAENSLKGEGSMSFKEFEQKEFEEQRQRYAREAEERWGNTEAWQQSRQRSANRTKEQWASIQEEAAEIFRALGAQMDKAPEAPEVQELIARWQQHLNRHYYDCSPEILAGLGQMYEADERFAQHLNQYGEGLAAFMSRAIAVYCG